MIVRPGRPRRVEAIIWGSQRSTPARPEPTNPLAITRKMVDEALAKGTAQKARRMPRDRSGRAKA